MKSKFIKIKGKLVKILKVNGIWVYKKYRCHCPCNKRIPVLESHKKNGIPDIIKGHTFGGKHLSEETIEKMREAHIGKIPWNKNKTNVYSEESLEKMRNSQIGLQSGKKNGMFGKHYSKEAKEKASKSHKQYYQEHPEAIEKLRELHTGKPLSEEIKIKQRKSAKKRYKEHPEHMKNARKGIKSVSKPELTVRNYLDELKVDHIPNVHEIIGTPDDIIPTEDGHPIALFMDGCHFHGCLTCYPIDEDSHENWKYHAFKRNHDRMINERLTEQGYRIIRIWEHDVDNGNYKKIIKRFLKRSGLWD